MTARELREQIEATDARLHTAQAELAALRERATFWGHERAQRLEALRVQEAAIEAELTQLAARTEALVAERAALKDRLGTARATVQRNVPRGWVDSDDGQTKLADVVNPVGWRKTQPWYTRLLWWVFEVKEWK